MTGTQHKATYLAESNPSKRPEAGEPHGGEAETAQATPPQPRDSRGGTRPEASDISVSGSLASLADQNPSKRRFAEALEDLRAALVELEAIPAAELDEPTRELRDNTRAMLDRYDRDAYDDLVS